VPAPAAQKRGEEPTGIRAAHHRCMLRKRDKREAVALAFADEALRLRLLEEDKETVSDHRGSNSQPIDFQGVEIYPVLTAKIENTEKSST